MQPWADKAPCQFARALAPFPIGSVFAIGTETRGFETGYREHPAAFRGIIITLGYDRNPRRIASPVLGLMTIRRLLTPPPKWGTRSGRSRAAGTVLARSAQGQEMRVSVRAASDPETAGL